MRKIKQIPSSHGWKCITRISAILVMTWSVGFSQQRLFEVWLAEKVPFNWPEPPKIEQADFFKIASQGKALCVIQYHADQEVQKIR